MITLTDGVKWRILPVQQTKVKKKILPLLINFRFQRAIGL
uniref:Uncharacterized protein n=1 Tax=Siphoviridae sp. ctnPP24 TaxID=2825662 RepID=A0A8S5TYS8_9CAUD|nr:MAG TPA: hypothetical protein [Siphoviridae sp. ctnPP24]